MFHGGGGGGGGQNGTLRRKGLNLRLQPQYKENIWVHIFHKFFTIFRKIFHMEYCFPESAEASTGVAL